MTAQESLAKLKDYYGTEINNSLAVEILKFLNSLTSPARSYVVQEAINTLSFFPKVAELKKIYSGYSSSYKSIVKNEFKIENCGYCYNGIVLISKKENDGTFTEEAAACNCEAGRQYPCFPQVEAIIPNFPYGFKKVI